MGEEAHMNREKQGSVFFERSDLSASDWHKDLLVFWLFHTSIQMQVSLNRCFLNFGITFQETNVLLRCVQAGTISPGRLAAVLGKDKGKITRYVDRLQAGRLVKRDVLRRDRRFSTIKPTRKGKQLARELSAFFDDIRKKLFAGIEQRDARCLEQILPQLCRNAGQIKFRRKGNERRRRRIGTQRSEAKRAESPVLQSDGPALAPSLNGNGREGLLEESTAFREFREEGEGLVVK
jgi:DNA-binding MarR family transcriptional regulator